MDPNRYVDTGYILNFKKEVIGDSDINQNHIIFHPNQNGNLVFYSEKKTRKLGKRNARVFHASIFRSHSYLDLIQLDTLSHKMKQKENIHDIDAETVLATYEGHTFFSLFFDKIMIYEKILE